tara:strand:- start:85 stop:519 length:435 start_codon:yes stop_codon:yes gene_type:complete
MVEAGCKPQSVNENSVMEMEQIASFLKKNDYQPSIDEGTKMILVLTDISCPTCNKSYALFLEKYVTDSTVAIVVSASPTALDISAFYNKEVTNVVIDHRNQFRNLTSLKGSGAILLNKNEIDTIVELSAKRLEADFQFIEEQLK